MIKKLLFSSLLLIILLLGSCGESDDPDTGSSEWDQMVWDQDNWS